MPVTVGMMDHRSGSACSYLSCISTESARQGWEAELSRLRLHLKQGLFLTDIIKTISSPLQIISSDNKDSSEPLPNILNSKPYINLIFNSDIQVE